MSYKLSGINPLAYMGVEPSTPPQMVVQTRPPTINDNNFNLGTYWLIAAPPPTTDWELWILVDLSQGIATWKQLFPGSGGGGADQFDEDVGIAVPALGIIQVKGGENINTVGDNANKITINLNESIHLPSTLADGSAGVLFLGATGGVGGFTFLHNYGTGNTFLGQDAGNLTLTVLSATDNTGIGAFALNDLTTGAGNVSLGAASLTALTTGINNVALGASAGSNYTSSESNNIIIGNTGTTGESNTIRIGVEATQTQAFMAGVYNRSVGATNAQVFIDNTGKLGTMESGQSGSVIVTTFTTSGTWTKNANTKIVEFYMWNGGSGGASGSQKAIGSLSGGGGGSAGCFRLLKVIATFTGATESITVGAGGAGGAAQTLANTAGNNGSLGGQSGVGSMLTTARAYTQVSGVLGNNDTFGLGNGNGGAPPLVMDGFNAPTFSGSAGLGTAGTPPGTARSGQDFGWFRQGNSIPTTPAFLANYIGGSGGSGGNTSFPTGGFGADFVDIDDLTTIYAGASGGAPNTDGNNGVVPPTSGAMFIGGGGGGGGGVQTAGRAGNGGNGAVPGGGGGGGGGSINGTNSGTGGSGGAGTVIVVEYL